jgi:hypothetical protein
MITPQEIDELKTLAKGIIGMYAKRDAMNKRYQEFQSSK